MCGARIGALISKNHDFMDMALKFGQARLKDADKDFVFDAAKADMQKFDKVIDEIEPGALRIDGLNNIEGVICPKPEGAFYAIAELPVKDADHF